MSRFLEKFRWAFTRYAFIFPFLQLGVFLPLQLNRTDQDRDTSAYYLAMERVQHGASMYEYRPPPGPHVVDQWYYLYPPFFASATALLPRMSYQGFARFWVFVMLAGFWVFAACLARIVEGRITFRGTLVAGAALQFVPGVATAMNMGQADVLIWAMVGVALAYPGLRGAGFMAAALAKVHGVWPMAAAALRDPWRTLRSAVPVALAAVGIAIFVLGPADFLKENATWFRDIAPTLGQGQLDPGDRSAELVLPGGLGRVDMPIVLPPNLSLSFAPLQLARSLGWWSPPPGNLGTPLRLYLILLGVGAPVLVGWLQRRRSVTMHSSLVLSAALLFAPILKITNLPLVLLPIVVGLGERRAEGEAEPVP
jgi:hypothetical protein